MDYETEGTLSAEDADAVAALNEAAATDAALADAMADAAADAAADAPVWGCADYEAEGCEGTSSGDGDNCPPHGGHTPEQSATHRAGGACDNSGCAA